MAMNTGNHGAWIWHGITSKGPVRPGNLQAVSGFGQESHWATESSFEHFQNNLAREDHHEIFFLN